MNGRATIRFAFGVCSAAPARQTIELAADLARLLSATMTALMIEDGAADALGSIPFAREFVVGRDVWNDIGAQEIAARRESARRRALSLFRDVALAAGLPTDVQAFASIADADMHRALAEFDVVALPAPERGGEWMMLPFASMAEAALHGRAAAIVLPSRARLKRGPIVALATSADDKAIELAGRLARAADENLIVLIARLGAVRLEHEHIAQVAGIDPQRLRILDLGGAGVDDFTHKFGMLGERAIVLARTFLPDGGFHKLLRLAALRGVPVMIPGETDS